MALSVHLHVTVVDTTAYDVLLGTEFMAAVRGAYDIYTEMFTYRWNGINGRLRQHTVSAPCHSPSPPLIAYACFSGLLSGEADLQDVQGADDDVIPVEEDIGYHTSPLQLAAIRLQHLAEACDRTESVRLCEEVRVDDLARRGDAVARLVDTYPLALPTLLPSSKWLGDAVHGAVPIDAAIRMMSPHAKHNGLHVLELFGGIGLGVLRTALAAGYTVRCYTYVDRDATS